MIPLHGIVKGGRPESFLKYCMVVTVCGHSDQVDITLIPQKQVKKL